MPRLIILLAAASLPLGGCNGALNPPQSIGDKNSGFRYIPVDPLPVSYTGFGDCPPRTAGASADVLDALPDLSVRVGTRLISGEASGKGGPVTIGVSGNNYELVQDFIAHDETNLRFEVPKDLTTERTGKGVTSVTTTRSEPVARLLSAGETGPAEGKEIIVVPVYVGVGLRLSAAVTVRKGNVALDFGALGAAARADRVRGSLVVQSLGLSGPKMATLIPLPGEIDPITIQNAAVAVGGMKALLYASDTQRWPRVVGIHYPFAEWDPRMVNAIVAALAATPIPWKPCNKSGVSN